MDAPISSRFRKGIAWISISLLGMVSPVALTHNKRKTLTCLQGNIVVLLPPTFHGPVAFRTRSGRSNIIFLPAFAERARTLRGSDRETFVHLSPSAANAEISANSQGDDYCLISTRHGKIIVGLSGIDQKPVEGDSYEVNKADTDDDTDSESN